MNVDLATAVISLIAAVVGGTGGAVVTSQHMTLAAARREDRKRIMDGLLPQVVVRLTEPVPSTVDQYPILRKQLIESRPEYWVAVFWVIGDVCSRTGWRDRRAFAAFASTLAAAGIDLRRHAYARDDARRRPRPEPLLAPDDPQAALLFTLACDRFHYHLMRSFDGRWERLLARYRHRQAQRRNYSKALLDVEAEAIAAGRWRKR